MPNDIDGRNWKVDHRVLLHLPGCKPAVVPQACLPGGKVGVLKPDSCKHNFIAGMKACDGDANLQGGGGGG